MELAKDVGIQVIIIFLLMLIGLILTATGKLSKQSIKDITDLVLGIASPCVLINAYQQKVFSANVATELLYATLLAFVVQVVAIFIGMLIFRKDEKEHYRINIFCTAYSNCGFMAIPLLKATLGNNGVFFGSAYLAVFYLLSWTHGLYLISGDKKDISIKNILKNPGIIGTIIALGLFLFNIKLPMIISDIVGHLAGLNTPLAMIVLGTYLLQIKPKEMLKNKNIYLSILTRLFLVPLVGIGIALLLPMDSSIKMAVLIPAACPAAAAAALFANKYNKDADYACEVVSVTTILAVLTLPIIVIIANLIGI